MEVSKLKSSWIMLTNQCNLKCKYCWLTKYYGDVQPKRMTFWTALRSIDFICDMGEEGVGITFFGGEPLLEFDLIKAIMDQRPNLNYGLYTNSVLLDDNKLNYLIENRDFIRIILSIDGLQSTNLEWRGCNYDEEIAKKVFKRFKTSSARFTVLDPKTCYAGAKYLQNLGAPKITINFPHFVDLPDGYDQQFDEEVQRIKGNYSLNAVTTISDCRKKTFCKASMEYIVVSPEGDIYPCDLFYWVGKDKLGNVNDGIDEVLRREFLEKVNSLKSIESSCIAEQLYYTS